MDEATDALASLSADGVLLTLAWAAGVPEDATVHEVDEVAMELLDEQNTFCLEIWTRFHFEEEGGQQGVAHLPGRLDALIPRAVRNRARITIREGLADS